ncbi:hypothetical protein JW758_01130 [Candidatus Peregrinibacteria bacterium]|nr:hypothetical protein [Candidatus Peregrinibacteria bacterium]
MQVDYCDEPEDCTDECQGYENATCSSTGACVCNNPIPQIVEPFCEDASDCPCSNGTASCNDGICGCETEVEVEVPVETEQCNDTNPCEQIPDFEVECSFNQCLYTRTETETVEIPVKTEQCNDTNPCEQIPGFEVECSFNQCLYTRTETETVEIPVEAEQCNDTNPCEQIPDFEVECSFNQCLYTRTVETEVEVPVETIQCNDTKLCEEIEGFTVECTFNKCFYTRTIYEEAVDSTITIRVETDDQYGNPVNGTILLNGTVIGQSEVELTFDSSDENSLAFDNLPGYAPPASVQLSDAFQEGERYKATYTRDGAVANVCVTPKSEEGLYLPDATISVNGIELPSGQNSCYTVNIEVDNEIVGGGIQNLYTTPIFIPKDTLAEGETYNYELLYMAEYVYIYLFSLPVQGEIFRNGISVGHPQDNLLYIPISKEGGTTFSFGDVEGYTTPEDIIVYGADYDYEDSTTFTFYSIYDSQVNSLVCIENDNGNTLFTINEDDREYNGEWNRPTCVALNTSETHTLHFQDRQNYQPTTDSLFISQDSHVGCTGEFVPGGQLNCIVNYEYVQQVEDRTHFIVRIDFTAPLLGSEDYPISGRYEEGGLIHENSYVWKSLELSEDMDITFLSIGYLQPSIQSFHVNSSELSVDDEAYEPSENTWIYKVEYVAPQDAIETCVSSFNQNGVNVSSETYVRFDGFDDLNQYEEDQDCHWLSPTESHEIVPAWLTGYYKMVDVIHIPAGQLVDYNQFNFTYVPESTNYQICVGNITVDSPLEVNGNSLGFTGLSYKCIAIDKTQDNEISIGNATRSFPANSVPPGETSAFVDFSDF